MGLWRGSKPFQKREGGASYVLSPSCLVPERPEPWQGLAFPSRGTVTVSALQCLCETGPWARPAVLPRGQASGLARIEVPADFLPGDDCRLPPSPSLSPSLLPARISQKGAYTLVWSPSISNRHARGNLVSHLARGPARLRPAVP